MKSVHILTKFYQLVSLVIQLENTQTQNIPIINLYVKLNIKHILKEAVK